MQVTTVARMPVLIAVLICMCMVAIEATIVATAMPQIANRLGDFELYSWVFSAYLLAQTSTTMLFGKLADVFGRKRILFIGLAIFAIASLLAGYADSILTLVILRGLQGLGAGSIHPVAITLVGDLYRGAERGKVQGYFLGVWVVSSLLGPPLGSVVVEYLSWEWVFWLNLPFCAVAALIYWIFLKEKIDGAVRSFDLVGSSLMIVLALSFVVVLVCFGAGQTLGSVLAILVFLALLSLFLWHQSRTEDGIISLGLWQKRPILVANCATLLSSMTTSGLSAYFPLYLQVVARESPSVAGLTLSAMLLSWQVAAMAASRFFHLFGFRLLFTTGGVILPIGTGLLLLLGPGTPVALPVAASLITGFGMGLINMASLLMTHEILEWGDRASATAANLFARNLGSAVGASGFGLILNALLDRGGATLLSSQQQIGRLLDGSEAGRIASQADIASFDTAAYWTFFSMFCVSVATGVICFLLPDVRASPRKP